jgi:division protein CdvB (Snf7/Vps24/ESCRT-III family)
MTPVFEMQRTMIEQNRKAITDGFEAQKAAVKTMVDSMGGSQELAERNVELTRSATHAYFDAVESAMPEDAAEFDELRASLDEGFDTFEDSQAEAWSAMQEAMEESGTTYEEFVDSYVEAVDSSFDAFIEGHERVEANVDAAAESVEVPVQSD